MAVDDVGEVALEGASGFAVGLSFGFFSGEVGTGARVQPGLGERDAVDRGVELAVAGGVKPVTAAGLA